jgi:hypothetical protein
MAIKSKTWAKLKWLPKEAGGRDAPPSGLSYSTPARFEKCKDDWPKNAWSLVLDFSAAPETRTMAEVRFLVNESPPQDLLQPGSKFDLFEGHSLVASGEIID